MDKGGIFISYSYNGNEIEGIDEFKNELDLSYPCHGVSKWLPAASEGGEFWLQAFVDAPFWMMLGAIAKDIIKDTIVYGGKKYVLSPLKSAISNLRKRNDGKWNLKVLKATFSFSDVEEVIGGFSEDDFDKLSTIFKMINEAKEKLVSDEGFDIMRIEMPAEVLPSNGKWVLDSWRYDSPLLEKSIWIITYKDNSKALFDSSVGDLHDIDTWHPKEYFGLFDIIE